MQMTTAHVVHVVANHEAATSRYRPTYESIMLSAEQWRSAHRRAASRDRRVASGMAAARAGTSSGATSTATSSVSSSESAPRSNPQTGVPHAKASAATKPYGSSHRGVTSETHDWPTRSPS